MEFEALNVDSVGQDGGHVSMASLSPFLFPYNSSPPLWREDRIALTKQFTDLFRMDFVGGKIGQASCTLPAIPSLSHGTNQTSEHGYRIVLGRLFLGSKEIRHTVY